MQAICVVALTPEASDRIKHRYVLRPLAVLPEQSLCGPRLYPRFEIPIHRVYTHTYIRTLGAIEKDIDSLSRAPSIVCRVIYACIEQILFPLLFDILFTHCMFMKYCVRAVCLLMNDRGGKGGPRKAKDYFETYRGFAISKENSMKNTGKKTFETD